MSRRSFQLKSNNDDFNARFCRPGISRDSVVGFPERRFRAQVFSTLREFCEVIQGGGAGLTYRQVLKQPRPEDVGRDLGKDAPLLLVLLARRVVVLLAGALAAADTRVTRVTCEQTNKKSSSSLLSIYQNEISAFSRLSFTARNFVRKSFISNRAAAVGTLH